MGVSTAWIPAAEPFDGGSVLGFLEARAVRGWRRSRAVPIVAVSP